METGNGNQVDSEDLPGDRVRTSLCRHSTDDDAERFSFSSFSTQQKKRFVCDAVHAVNSR